MSDKDLTQYVGRLAEDFRFFLAELWLEVGLPDPARHQVDMADWLQTGPRRRGVKAFRGASKTWITIAYCLWRLFIDSGERIMLVSKSEAHSKSSLHMARQWIKQVRFLQHLSPDKKSGQRDAATMFDIGPCKHDRTASFTAYGIGGQLTGARASVIVSDDVETAQNTLTLEMRQRLREQVTEFENILIPGGDILILGTPHHEETLLDRLTEGGYTFRAWPARIPPEGMEVEGIAPLYEVMLSEGCEKGDPVWPERFTHQELSEREAAEGRSVFAMQYMLQSQMADDIRYPLRLKDLIIFPMTRDKAPVTIAWGTHNDRGGPTRLEEIPSLGFGTDGFFSPIMYDERWMPYSGTKMSIDPSGRGEDKTAYAVVSYLNGYLWVKAVGGFDGGFSEQVLEGLAYQARLHNARQVIVEENLGAGMFTQLFEPVLQRFFTEPGEDSEYPDGWAASVEDVRVTGQKELRIIGAMEPPMNQHRVIFHPDVAHNQDLQKQMTRLTKDRGCLRHDDEIDALSLCINQWQDYMSTDPKKHAEERYQRFLEDELREHYGAMGIAGQEPRWFTHND